MRTGVTKVDIEIRTNVWWDDAFQFGHPDDFTWDFANKTFLLDVKNHPGDAMAVLSLSSTAGTIVVDDTVNRRLHVLVDDHNIRAVFSPGCYHYDLIMVDNATGQRDALMWGDLIVKTGVTVED